MTDASAIIDTLNDLIETSKDGEYGFSACADQAKSTELRTLFENRARECREAAEQLQSHVRELGGAPDADGTVLGKVHRGWVSVRATLSTHDDLAILKECERGEDAALESYREALTEELPAPIKALVERQLEGVQRNHDMIKRLRDSTQGRS
jgi:uncharacterized protein (TIGR02284 family)